MSSLPISGSTTPATPPPGFAEVMGLVSRYAEACDDMGLWFHKDQRQYQCAFDRAQLVHVDIQTRINAILNALLLIALTAEGSTTANSLPHIARIARESITKVIGGTS